MEFKKCEHCGSPLQVYRYPFAKRYANALKRLYFEGVPKKISHLPITKSQKDHFHLMEYWGLIERYDKKMHHWIVTQKGYDFLIGNEKIYKYVWVFKAQHVMQPENDDTVNVLVSIDEIGSEPINREKALENSVPYKENLRTQTSLLDLA